MRNKNLFSSLWIPIVAQVLVRAIILIAVWYGFARISSWYIFNYVDDIGATYWSVSILFIRFPVFFIWLLIEVLCAWKKISAKKSWIIFALFLTVNLLFSPLLVGVFLWLSHWMTHFSRF
jgi:hypothetical protein